jgi:endonuclease/exonuclease/phosphatase family metal-dependent hydrolase
VENDSCLDDLTRRSPLREAGYRYVMTHSPDRRGIDVALLYQRSTFRLLHHQSIRIPQGAVKRSTPTRDILHVAGKLQSGDTLDVMVCHLPSRSGGKARTEPFRMVVADIIARTADSLVQVRQHPYLIVMGDFNDYPTDRLTDRLTDTKAGLRNLMKGMPGGTYRYRGEWGIFDQFFVSAEVPVKCVEILRFPFLLEEDGKYGGDKPFRTYHGMRYQGGYSDHLPVGMEVSF